MLIATVKSGSDEEGWGVLVSPDVGEDMKLEIENLGEPLQDGYRFRASRVVPES
jgi:hypothetical protein